MSEEREALARTFDSAADLYLGARPDYPAQLFDRLIRATGLQPGDRVLEVGAGPGKATLPLAQWGLRVTALEPGPALAARAREALADYPVEVVETSLEDWHGEPGAYDAVVAATSWHWVDPQIRYAAAARALRPDGHLAVWSTAHVFPVGGDPFFAELQEVYDAIGEGQPPGEARPAPGELADLREEIEASGLFDVVVVEHFDWSVDYDGESYIRLLSTFSSHMRWRPMTVSTCSVRSVVGWRSARTDDSAGAGVPYSTLPGELEQKHEPCPHSGSRLRCTLADRLV